METLPLICWALAGCGAAAALIAALGRYFKFLPLVWVGRAYTLSYIAMGLSVVVFFMGGFADSPRMTP